MVVCAVDDLIFSVKISTAAKALGVGITFERKPENVLAAIRERRPSLVIFDLNSARLKPMALIAALKSDPELNGIRTIGYVSHVDADAVAAARGAGIDQVLARSTFSERLGDILTSASPTR